MALSIDFRGSVSFPPGYPSYRTLTLVLVGLTPTEYTSLRWTYADSILDRLVHNAYRIDLTGGSIRKLKSRKPDGTDGTDKP